MGHVAYPLGAAGWHQSCSLQPIRAFYKPQSDALSFYSSGPDWRVFFVRLNAGLKEHFSRDMLVKRETYALRSSQFAWLSSLHGAPSPLELLNI